VLRATTFSILSELLLSELLLSERLGRRRGGNVVVVYGGRHGLKHGEGEVVEGDLLAQVV
jgi:hypothetical protein